MNWSLHFRVSFTPDITSSLVFGLYYLVMMIYHVESAAYAFSPLISSFCVSASFDGTGCKRLSNLSVTDCGSNDPDLKQEMEKQFVDILMEELKLQEAVADEHSRHVNITFGEAKRVASQYQKEAEKCISATETCEEARERAEALLIRERKVTTSWEQRARQMGWEGE
ncbi:Calmodulin-binding protein isoform 1 [Hibiscus syriacus]|uniref:Calmodulin-binding protein isoform 1 n=1 Tax=Hibiscus syriacus TaxID=106335 RepID=A0A6A3AEJ4_HIBSY|nr:Calmodulin-binding protein isoform 1 [Hibiscus syriacus]